MIRANRRRSGRCLNYQFRIWSLLLVGLFLPLDQAMAAAEWLLTPSVALGGTYNDNIRLTTGPHEATWGTELSPRLRLNAQTANWSNKADAYINARKYPDEPTLDFNNQHGRFISTYQSQLHQLQLNLRGDITSTLTTEQDDQGLVQVSKERKHIDVMPTWNWSLSEVSSLSLAYQFTETVYQDAALIGLNNYLTRSWFAALNHRISAKDLLTMTLYRSQFISKDADSRSTDTGFQGGLEHAFSETVSTTLAIGGRNTDSTFGLLEEEDSGFLLQSSLEKRYRTYRLMLKLGRNVSPSGIGSLNQRDQLSLDYRKTLTTKLTLTAVVNGYDNQSLNTAISNQDRRYYNARFGLSWKWARNWALRATTGYTKQRYDNSVAEANATIFEVNVAYNLPEARLFK